MFNDLILGLYRLKGCQMGSHHLLYQPKAGRFSTGGNYTHGSIHGWSTDLHRHLPRSIRYRPNRIKSNPPFHLPFLSNPASKPRRISRKRASTIWQRSMGHSLRLILHNCPVFHPRTRNARVLETTSPTY